VRHLAGSRRWRWGLAVAPVVAVGAWWCSCLGPLHAHTGDGTFADLSRPIWACGIPVFNLRGYSVSMSGFDMSDPHHAEYRVAGLPNIGEKCMLYLAMDDPEDKWLMQYAAIRKLSGHLRLEALDEQGELLCHAEGPLSEWIWGNWRGAHRLYKLHALSFRARRGREYTLRLSYEGDRALAGMHGYCYLECGAHK
jgi:hypothetical protein